MQRATRKLRPRPVDWPEARMQMTCVTQRPSREPGASGSQAARNRVRELLLIATVAVRERCEEGEVVVVE